MDRFSYLGVEEIDQNEMMDIFGGNILADSWDWVKQAAKDTCDFFRGFWEGLTQ